SAIVLASPFDADLPFKPARVPLLSSGALVEPAVFGILKPVLVLPSGIKDDLAPDQLKAVILHEVCHIQRRDNLATSLYMVAETVFWFYPLVRWIGKRLLEERERACDEHVLRLGCAPVVYAEGILSVCKRYLESPWQSASGVTGSDLKRRVRAILDE